MQALEAVAKIQEALSLLMRLIGNKKTS